MMPYENEVLAVLDKFPRGLRLRDIGGQVGVWHVALVQTMNELERQNKVVSIPGGDRANMEFYYIWKKI